MLLRASHRCNGRVGREELIRGNENPATPALRRQFHFDERTTFVAHPIEPADRVPHRCELLVIHTPILHPTGIDEHSGISQ